MNNKRIDTLFGVPVNLIAPLQAVRDGEPIGDLQATRDLIAFGYMAEEPTRHLTPLGAARLESIEDWLEKTISDNASKSASYTVRGKSDSTLT